MSERMPPKRRRTPNERGMTEEEILRDRSGLDPMARYPFATSRDPGYVVGGPQMTDPRHFEMMRRNREEARTQGTRLKGGGMVEIEIKVGGKGKHKMPDGSMMDDHEMEEGEEYKKGGRVKKMAKGGATGGKFIQKAIKKPGALRTQLGAKPGQKIPAKKLAAAAKAPGKLGQRARFAQTLAKMRKK
jgi:hypothetical protein